MGPIAKNLMDDMKTHLGQSVDMSEDLDKMYKCFLKCQDSWDAFSPIFRNWKTKRIVIIEKLEDIIKKLDKYKADCNIAKVVGGSAGILGGIMNIVGIALVPFTFGISTPLIIAGTATAVVGGTTNLGTSITEAVLIKDNLDCVREHLQEHQEDSELLNKWVQDAADFIDAANNILDVKIFKKIIETLSASVCSDADISAFDRALESACEVVTSLAKDKITSPAMDKITSLVKENILTESVSVATKDVLNLILRVPKLFYIMWKLVKLHKSDPLVFAAILSIGSIGLQVAHNLDLSSDAVAVVLNATRITSGADATATAMTKAVTSGILAGIALLLDVASVVVASVDIYDGSKSEHATQIREVKTKLENGLMYVSTLYDEDL